MLTKYMLTEVIVRTDGQTDGQTAAINAFQLSFGLVWLERLRSVFLATRGLIKPGPTS